MKRIAFILILYISTTHQFSKAQNIKRSVDELTADTSGWTIVKEWAGKAKNNITILPTIHKQKDTALYQLQITTHSINGAIVYFTGGILVDYGWIRILGSGSTNYLKRTLPMWNKDKTFRKIGTQPSYLLVADDVIGGLYAINGGGLGDDIGKVYYFAPDRLRWENLNVSYTQLIDFFFNGDLNTFYKDFRWNNWKEDLKQIDGDQAFSFYPFLFTAEGKNIDNNIRKKVSIDEIYQFNMEAQNSLNTKGAH